jgi:maleylacetate reductase
VHNGVVFGAESEVVFGRRAPAPALVERSNRLGTISASPKVGGSLNYQTNVIENIRRTLGARCIGNFDRMPRSLRGIPDMAT